MHFGPSAAVGACGGCSWQHIAYPEQLRLKTALLTRLVRSAVPDAPPVGNTLPATPLDAPWGFRNKVHFVFGNGHSTGRRPGRLTMGHYVRGSRRVLPVRECPVHDERGNAFAFRLRQAFIDAGVHAAAAGAGGLRSLAVRVACHTDEMMATLIVSRDADRKLRGATRGLLEANGAPTSMHLNEHARDDALIFGTRTRKLAGLDRMREQIGTTSFLMSPTAFFQTNVQAAEILVKLVLEAVPPASRVADLYAGSGLFAIPLARAGHDVTAIEENRKAVADGEAALQLNRDALPRCRFLVGSVERSLSTVRGADVVVLDPPREGCSELVLRGIFGRLRPRRAVYVSCDPESLAKDLRTISASGYRIQRLQPVDMFPHTAHIETVVVLDRGRLS